MHVSVGVWQSNRGAQPPPGVLLMQSYPGRQLAPVVHEAATQVPTGSPHKHTSPVEHSES